MTDKADHIAWAAEAVAVYQRCRFPENGGCPIGRAPGVGRRTEHAIADLNAAPRLLWPR